MKTLPEPMQINVTFVIVFSVFITLFWILKKFYVDVYAKVIGERENIIDGAEKRYNDVETTYREKLDYFEEELSKARKNAYALRERFIGDAESEKMKIISRARLQTKESAEKKDAEISEIIDNEKKLMDSHINSLAENIAEKLLGRKLS